MVKLQEPHSARRRRRQRFSCNPGVAQYASKCERQKRVDMPTTASKPNGSSDVDLALPRLTALLSQQEKLLEHPWSNADIYLYDFRAQQISDLIVELEDENTLKRRRTLIVGAKAPAPSWSSSSVENSATKRQTDPIGRVSLVAVSIWIAASNVFARIRAFLASPLFHRSQKRESSSSAAVT